MGGSRLPIPATAEQDDRLRSYAAWFVHFRKMQPADLGWKENGASDRWAHEMVAATLLPVWIGMFGGHAAPRFAKLKKAFEVGQQKSSTG